MNQQKQTGGLLADAVLDERYRIERLLGEGGMGAVYLATDLRLEKRVAVKVMTRELAANPETLSRFYREARVTSGLGHPHIVQVNDFCATPDGEPFMVMEFLEGEDLYQRLRRLGRLSLGSTVHVVKQVASALAATHAKNIVHRDLKPANIYLLEVAGEADFVKVLDFGISKVRTATTKLTRTSSIIGTPNYMSPEQAKGKGEEIDERTDQWALACIAWECLCGEGPFVAENVPSILFQIVHEAPPSLVPNVTGVTAQLEGVLLRALTKDKRERYPNVIDFAFAFEAAATGTMPSCASTAVIPPQNTRVLAGQPAPAPATTFTRAAGEAKNDGERTSMRGRWVVGAALAGTVAVAVAGLVVQGRSSVSPKGQRTHLPAAAAAPVSPPPREAFAPPTTRDGLPAAAVSAPAATTTAPDITVVPGPLADPRKAGNEEKRPKAAAATPRLRSRTATPTAPSDSGRRFAGSSTRKGPPEETVEVPARPSVAPAASPAPKPLKARSKEDQWRVD